MIRSIAETLYWHGVALAHVDNWTGAVAGVLAMEIVLLGMGRTILLDGSMMGLGTVLLRCVD